LPLIPSLWIAINFWFAASTWQRAGIASTGSKGSVSYDCGAENDGQPLPLENSLARQDDTEHYEDETAHPIECEDAAYGRA
jgi:hypothetical protein